MSWTPQYDTGSWTLWLLQPFKISGLNLIIYLFYIIWEIDQYHCDSELHLNQNIERNNISDKQEIKKTFSWNRIVLAYLKFSLYSGY